MAVCERCEGGGHVPSDGAPSEGNKGICARCNGSGEVADSEWKVEDLMTALQDSVDRARHRRYESSEFDYSGCVVCDSNGDTLGWPCPTIKALEA